jgi:hypothetical protein
VDKFNIEVMSDKPRKEHFTARLLTNLSTRLQLPLSGHPASPSPTALGTVMKTSMVIIDGQRCINGNCRLYVTLWDFFVAICKGVSRKQLKCFYSKFRISLIFQTNDILECPNSKTRYFQGNILLKT